MGLSVSERFWAKVDKRGPDECWLWQGTTSRGYGYIRCKGKGVSVHRIAWFLANGPIPDGLHVLHRCDPPACVNLSHLFLGTASDNARDRNEKGRAAPRQGTNNGRSRFTQRGVGVVRAMSVAGVTGADIARFFGVHETTVYFILNGKHWACA